MMRVWILALGFFAGLASIIFAMVFWVGSRTLDPIFWPYTGIARATYGIEAPTRASGLGRDCFIQDDEVNLLEGFPREELNEILMVCSAQQQIVAQEASSDFVKAVARCNYNGRVLERSVLVFRGTSIPPDICTVSLFDLDSDLGVGQMTMSSYDDASGD